LYKEIWHKKIYQLFPSFANNMQTHRVS